MKKFLPILALWLAPAPAQAGLVQISVEPIIGLEWVQKLLPSPHTSRRLTYGGRLTAGLEMISGELEYTRGDDTETYSTSTEHDVTDRIKLGARATKSLGIVSILGRGGAEAMQNRHEETIAGVTTSITNPIHMSPYLGAGASLALGSKLSVSVETVAIFTDLSHLDKTEFQTTAGFAVHLP